MSIEEFEEKLKEFDDSYYAIEESNLYLVYKKHADGPEFIGSVSVFDVEVYDIEDVLRDLGIAYVEIQQCSSDYKSF